MNCPNCGIVLKEHRDGKIYSWWRCKKCGYTHVTGSWSENVLPVILHLKTQKAEVIKPKWNPSKREK